MKTMNNIILFVSLGVLISQTYAVPPTESPDCRFWHTLARNMSQLREQTDMIQLSCTGTCTSIRCSGHIDHLRFIETLHLDKPFCFGVKLNHCSQPPSMDYYLEVPAQNISIADAITHNDVAEIKGPLGSTIVLTVKMEYHTSHVLFGVTGAVKMGSSEFLLNEKVFPDTYIDVPPCPADDQQRNMSAFTAPAVCTKSPPPTVAPKPSNITSKTLNKPCEVGLLQCSVNEMCKESDNAHSRNGLCVCDGFSHLSSTTGLCENPSVDTATTAQPPNKQPVKHNEQSRNWTPIIAGSIAGGLLLIVVIISIIIYIGRRRRTAMYQGRQQLLTDDPDDDDDALNVVI